MRRAAALPIMLFMLAMTSALAVGGVFVTRLVVTSVRATEQAAKVEPAAERALVLAVAQWDTLSRPLQPIGMTQPLAETVAEGVSTAVWVTRLSPRVYWIVVEARNGVRPVLRRRIGALIRVTDKSPALVSPRAWAELP